MKIAFYELEGWEEPIIRERLAGHELAFHSEKITSMHLPEAKDCEVLSIFVNSRITDAVLNTMPALKHIVTRSTGFDHIDLTECAKRNISVSYVPNYGDNTVAEFAFGLILSLARKLYPAIHQMKGTGSFALTGLRGFDLKGKTLGVVGTGRIGKESIKIAKGFDMQVIAYDPFPDLDFAHSMNIVYVNFEELLAKADIITIHCPYTPKTHHLINQGNIRLVKKGAYLVNTARGPIVETQAIVDGLTSGILAGAALDVLEEEGETKDELNLLNAGHPKEEELKTMLQNHILMQMPNVLMTPHDAFNSQEALERILHTTLDNAQAFLGGKPANLVPK